MNTDDILTQIDEAIDDWSVSPDAMRLGGPRQPAIRVRPPRVDTAALARISVRFTAAMETFKTQMAEVGKAMARLIESNDNLRRLLGLPIYDRHHPRPLCIDGHAYNRRRRNRRKR